MKKLSIYFAVSILVVLFLLIYSFFKSKNRAEEIVAKSNLSLSSPQGSLILFVQNDFKPCWYFRSQYNEAITGATFDIVISLFGNIITEPPKIPERGSPRRTGPQIPQN